MCPPRGPCCPEAVRGTGRWPPVSAGLSDHGLLLGDNGEQEEAPSVLQSLSRPQYDTLTQCPWEPPPHCLTRHPAVPLRQPGSGRKSSPEHTHLSGSEASALSPAVVVLASRGVGPACWSGRWPWRGPASGARRETAQAPAEAPPPAPDPGANRPQTLQPQRAAWPCCHPGVRGS